MSLVPVLVPVLGHLLTDRWGRALVRISGLWLVCISVILLASAFSFGSAPHTVSHFHLSTLVGVVRRIPATRFEISRGEDPIDLVGRVGKVS